MRVILRPAAAADIEEAFLWYEDRESGLGHEFLEAVQSVLTNVGAQPRAYPVIHRNTRRALLRRFPYGLFNRTYDERQSSLSRACTPGATRRIGDPERNTSAVES